MLTRYLPIFIILSFIAEILGTVGGFGSSVFFVPMASYFIDFQTVLGITALYHLSSNITKLGFFRKSFDKTLMLYLGIPAVLFVSIESFLSKYTNPKLLTLFLGVFLVSFGLLFLLNKTLIVSASKKSAVNGGSLSGLFAGILGTGGAIRGGTMTAFKHLYDIINQALQLRMNAAFEAKFSACDVVVYPDGLSKYNLFNSQYADELFEIGYKRTQEALQKRKPTQPNQQNESII